MRVALGMDSRILLGAALAVAAAGVSMPASAAFEKVEACRDPVDVTLGEPGFRDLSWTVCGDGGDLGGASAAWDTSIEPYSDELHAAVQAEEARASAVRATRRASLLDMALELDSRGTRKRVEAKGLAIGGPPRTVAGAVTLQAKLHAGRLVMITIVDESARAIARRLAEVTALRIDHIERLAETPMTLNFQLIPVRTILQFVAGEGGVLLLQAHRDRYAFSTAAEAKVFNAALEQLENLRSGDDPRALEAALERAVAAAPVPPEGPAVDITAELDELARLLAAREDYAGAERLQRRRLELEERIGGTRESATALAALDQIATLRGLQDDEAGSLALFEEVAMLAERVPGRADAAVVHALTALAFHAMGTRDDVAERYFARATAISRGFAPDSLAALRASNALAAHAFTLERLDREAEAVPLLERNLEIARAQYGDSDGMAGRAMEDLARVLAAIDELPRAAALLRDALAIRHAEGRDAAAGGADARTLAAAIAALGPYKAPIPDAQAVPAWRAAVAAKPPVDDVLSQMTRLLLDRAARQRTAAAPALAATCSGYGELMKLRAVARAADPEIVAALRERAERDCIAGKD